ncbi:MAG: hypothetical protein M1812_000933 [Candelaria pacifica]|nr:MAG: hypothetical protein M1812_000933 [Candelaria pacifica]
MTLKVADGHGMASLSTTLLPFLYGTQTLRKVFWGQTSGFLRHQPRYASTNVSEKKACYSPIIQNTSHAAPGSEENNDLSLNDDQPSSYLRRRRDSTITAAERETFTRIFNDLVESSAKQPRLLSDKNIRSLISAKDSRKRARHSDQVNARHSDEVSSILADAVTDSKSQSGRSKVREEYSSFRPIKPEAAPMGRSERIRQAIERYPPSLRAAAASALFAQRQQVEEIQTPGETSEKSLENVSLVDQHVQFVRRHELMRVEDMLYAAKTDIDVWKIVEEEVFSVIKKLNIELADPVAKNEKKGTKTAKGKKKDSVIPIGESKPKEVAEDKEVPSLSTIGPNYPAHLLVAVRLFRYKFPTSPLALALLPAIKKHGPISYVLGASTALYNELMAILWNSYGDFDGIGELLEEMDSGGVEFDEATVSLLERIEAEKQDTVDGRRGETLEALWKMQAMSKPLSALVRWKKMIKRRLEREEMAADYIGVVDDVEDTLDVA